MSPSIGTKTQKDLSEVSIDQIAGLEGIIVNVNEETKKISERAFYGLELEGKAVIINTGWDRTGIRIKILRTIHI
ncbi:hypothetical protein SAMN04488072_11341 [Lentibacillus halodurans]|uniref:Uncharacterized protein n=1 Tax=Lentibacillus halodurans TaxID=237679 RepID=A0A1I0ZSK8_9BACI|nr:hypothetical protein [Lentibacillus halodurans]SFB28655.1 hypothetical protein SAMN04488072_11341 [Lentibacillus halodurans]